MNKYLTAEEIYKKGCLKPDKHGPLVERLDTYAHVAGLAGGNRRFLWEPLKDFSQLELEVLRDSHRLSEKGMFGLLYVGNSSGVAVNRLMAITGCFVRNFVDARYMTVETALKIYAEEKTIPGKVTCIPNLFVSGCSLGWQKGMVYDFLLHHMSQGKLLFAYVQDLKGAGSEYGQSAFDHLSTRFFKVGGAK
jgi:hypothetical protein